MRLRSKDGLEYLGETSQDALIAMFKDSRGFTGDANLQAYMKGFARRAQFRGSNVIIRVDTLENFLGDATRHGLLTILEV